MRSTLPSRTRDAGIDAVDEPVRERAARRVGIVHLVAAIQILGDDHLLPGQVLENLVTNALRVTPRGGDVTIAVSQTEEGAEIAVTDTGPGIPADQLDTVVERLTRR